MPPGAASSGTYTIKALVIIFLILPHIYILKQTATAKSPGAASSDTYTIKALVIIFLILPHIYILKQTATAKSPGAASSDTYTINFYPMNFFLYSSKILGPISYNVKAIRRFLRLR
ncbi:hypothetical protein FACS1894172_18560 [Spirochaetia bacterium]|nr:hypothetical protein FACS1894164_02530 [Spirochaetia bacterium]GHU36063.1 hypothetical protein FACS1894172_18560 [Spirochaetia bacterium]